MKLSILVSALVVSAAAGFEFGDFPRCAQMCAYAVLTTDGCPLKDIACHCKNTKSINIVTGCVKADCSQSDAETTRGMVNDVCAKAGVPLRGPEEAPKRSAAAATSRSTTAVTAVSMAKQSSTMIYTGAGTKAIVGVAGMALAAAAQFL